MAHPFVSIDLEKVEHNARTLCHLCAEHGIAVTGVTKGTCGMPEVAQAMLRIVKRPRRRRNTGNATEGGGSGSLDCVRLRLRCTSIAARSLPCQQAVAAVSVVQYERNML